MAAIKRYGHYLDAVLIGAARLDNRLVLAEPRSPAGAIKITVNYITNGRLAGPLRRTLLHVLFNN